MFSITRKLTINTLGTFQCEEGMYVSELDLVKFSTLVARRAKTDEDNDRSVIFASYNEEDEEPTNIIEVHPLLRSGDRVTTGLSRSKTIERQLLKSRKEDEPATFWETVKNIASRCLQPPVVGWQSP
jgi:hypothetical protein